MGIRSSIADKGKEVTMMFEVLHEECKSKQKNKEKKRMKISKRISLVLMVAALVFSLKPVKPYADELYGSEQEFAYEDYMCDHAVNLRDYCMFDIDGNGVGELLFTHADYADSMYSDGTVATYKNGKVKLLKQFEGGITFYKIPGKHLLVVGSDVGGASNVKYSVYKIQSGKLKLSTTYTITSSGKFKKGKKTISQKTFDKFMDKLVVII